MASTWAANGAARLAFRGGLATMLVTAGGDVAGNAAGGQSAVAAAQAFVRTYCASCHTERTQHVRCRRCHIEHGD